MRWTYEGQFARVHPLFLFMNQDEILSVDENNYQV